MSESKQSLPSTTTLYDMLIGQYKLESHHTQTAVSDLYRAIDSNTQQPVAIEILHPSFSRSYCDAYIEKMQTVKPLEHPNIASIYSIGYVTQRPYIAREFIEGYRFSERLKQLEEQSTPGNSIYALKMVRELADALALAEEHQIYHSYLSPTRLILKHDSTLVLVDLGVPKLDGEYKEYKPTTPINPNDIFYLSPEQRNGKVINGRSHIYTLGVILHQLLTGLSPTAPPTKWQKMRGHTQNLRQIRPDLSPPLYELVEKCLHVEAWRRYQDLRELTAVLDATLEAETIYIQTGDTPPIIATTKERRPWMYLLVPLLLVLACSAIAYTAVQILQPDETTATQQLSKDDTTLSQTGAVATMEETATRDNKPTPKVTEETRIQITRPLTEQKFDLGSTIVFTWVWPVILEQGQTFVLFVADENEENEIGQVQQVNEQGMYELRVDSTTFAIDRGIYLWRVVLRDEESGEDLFISDTNPLRVVLVSTATAVSSPTPRPSNTPQPTNTAVLSTPTPQSTATIPPLP